MVSVLITGGLGFIGRNLADRLRSGKNVRIFDNLSRSGCSRGEDCSDTFIQGDIRDRDSLLHAMHGVEVVVHLAAFGSVVESIENPNENFENNVAGSFNVLAAARSAGVKRVIFASTGGALIGDAEPPVNESSLPKPISPYGASKLCGEAYCHAFAKAYGLKAVSLRFGNVYGPYSAHKRGVITMFIKSLLRGDDPLVIYGDGKASRDYVYVDDICKGIMLAMDAPLEGGEIFHLASGRETTILTLAKILCNIAEKPDHSMIFKPLRKGEVFRNFASYDCAERVLDFRPDWPLEDGLQVTWNWFREQGERIFEVEATDS